MPYTKDLLLVKRQVQLHGDIRITMYDHNDSFKAFFKKFSGNENEASICCQSALRVAPTGK